MTHIRHNISQRQRRARRTHGRVKAEAGRPKLLLTRSNRYLTLQVIGENGQVLACESDFALVKKGQLDRHLTKTERARATGQALAGKLADIRVKRVVVDRGAYQFHGRIKAAVDAVRESGIEA